MTRNTYWRDVAGPPAGAVRALHPGASVLMRAAWNVRVHRHHLMPAEGPVILAANHTGILDGPLLYAVVRRPVHALVKREIFRGSVGRALGKLGQISVDRFAPDPAAIKACLAVLERGHVLGVYPEGTRGLGDFGQIKPGLAYLGLCTGAPIVPVACLGVRAPSQPVGSLPRFRSRIDIVFGRPIDTEPVAWPRQRGVVRERAALLQERLREHVRDACALTGQEVPGRAPVAWVGPAVPARLQDEVDGG